jgi:hypothetical protein
MGSRPGACGEATGRWSRLRRLAPGSGRDPTTPSTRLLLACTFYGDRDELLAGLSLSLSLHRRDSCLVLVLGQFLICPVPCPVLDGPKRRLFRWQWTDVPMEKVF